eukprot:TRINITY_DN4599_c0_g1_i2.p1 TRINITY_DN4599_c0_g1~~TRINITY_DN4599_c0_g1_i2.p1  ORF type:complete len:255 (+),score=49.14 TRINITY_DN4599_c0_g1_i2:401-1165(+)
MSVAIFRANDIVEIFCASSSAVPSVPPAHNNVEHESAPPEVVTHKDYLAVFKTIIVGDSGTGKSCLIRRFISGTFDHRYRSKMGVDFLQKEWYEDDIITRMQIWDIAGQERLRSAAYVYYTEARSAIITIDLSNDITTGLNSVVKWKKDIEDNVCLPNGTAIPIILVGTKVDLVSKNQSIYIAKELDSFCQKNSFVTWYQTSAKANVNVTLPFDKLKESYMKGECRGPLTVIESLNKDHLKVKKKAKRTCCFFI